jgi:predicted HD phosphohydrolase
MWRQGRLGSGSGGGFGALLGLLDRQHEFFRRSGNFTGGKKKTNNRHQLGKCTIASASTSSKYLVHSCLLDAITWLSMSGTDTSRNFLRHMACCIGNAAIWLQTT